VHFRLEPIGLYNVNKLHTHLLFPAKSAINVNKFPWITKGNVFWNIIFKYIYIYIFFFNKYETRKVKLIKK